MCAAAALEAMQIQKEIRMEEGNSEEK